MTALIIPPRPDLLIRVQSLLTRHEPDPGDMAQLIRQDVALYTILLATVNSPLFRRSQRIDSVEHAVSVLGMSRVASLMQSVALRSSLDAAGEWLGFWDSAAEVAGLCQALSSRLQCMSGDHAYTFGMMHDIGSAVMRMNYPDYQSWALAEASCNGARTRKAERERYGHDRFELAGRLAGEWFMPEPVVQALTLQAHAQASLMGKAQVCDDVKGANALLILAKDISSEYHAYWNFDSRDALSQLVEKAVEYLAITQHEYLDIRDDLVEKLALADVA
ncbi:HDOD domain-containing protein [Thalassolituus sp. LLYu03]|uniref:HDOD domain-containing protein n=1 Tax=Thalassolituus sp. LLYu03 TaxID=3421656 RepID=UPI003D28B283